MKKINYYVIGGQYVRYCYGGCKTLLGAKRLAAKHDEYWDNWQGWHRPKIYRAEDCVEVENFYGHNFVPTNSVKKCWVYSFDKEKWVQFDFDMLV